MLKIVWNGKKICQKCFYFIFYPPILFLIVSTRRGMGDGVFDFVCTTSWVGLYKKTLLVSQKNGGSTKYLVKNEKNQCCTKLSEMPRKFAKTIFWFLPPLKKGPKFVGQNKKKIKVVKNSLKRKENLTKNDLGFFSPTPLHVHFNNKWGPEKKWSTWKNKRCSKLHEMARTMIEHDFGIPPTLTTRHCKTL